MAELQVNPLASIPIACQDSEIQANLKHTNTPISVDFHLSCDNQDAVKLAHNPIFHAKTKQIEAKHHFVKKLVLEGEIWLDYIHSKDNPADLVTKPLFAP